MEEGRASGELTDEEWKLIEERTTYRDIASDEEVRGLFDRYRGR